MKTVNFYHQNFKYQIKRNILDKHTQYFAKKSVDFVNVQLVDEFNIIYQIISEKTLNQFVRYFEKGQITLDYNNIYPIQYLSNKFEVTALVTKVNNYLKKEYKGLIGNILQKIEEKDYTLNSYEESILSFHIIEYIDDDKLLSLSISCLYRILSKYQQQKNQNEKPIEESTNECEFNKLKRSVKKTSSKRKFKSWTKKGIKPKSKKICTKEDEEDDDSEIEQKDKNEEEIKIINFLIKILKEKGRGSSVLLNAFSISTFSNQYLIEKLYESENDIQIDLNIIGNQMIKYSYEQNRENRVNKEDFKQQMDKMKNEYEKKITANR